MLPKNDRRALAIIFLIMAAHLPILFLPSVNLEFAFADAAKYLKTGDKVLLDQYFTYQANSLGFPIIAWIVAEASSVENMLLISRGISVFGILLFGIGIINLSKHLGRNDSHIVLLLILLNPLVWTFSARGTADFFPAALGIFSLSLLPFRKFSLRMTLIAGLLFGIAVVLKYHTMCIIVFAIALARTEGSNNRAYYSLVIFAALAILIPGIYIIAIKNIYGFWLTPPKYQAVHGLSIAASLNNLALYAGYIVFLCLPISVTIPRIRFIFRENWKIFLLGAAILFLIGDFVLSDRGEMNFGPLDRWLNSTVVNGGFLMLSFMVLSPIFLQSAQNKKETRQKKNLGIALLIVLIALALTRPAQRYLLSLLPFFVLASPIESIKYRLIAPYFAALLLIDIFIGYSQWCTGTAARQMVDEIARKGLISSTNPGAIRSHVGDIFYPYKSEFTSYTVIEGKHRNSVITVSKGFDLVSKSYSLVPKTNSMSSKNSSEGLSN